MTRGPALHDIHPAVEASVNTGAIEALTALYAQEARMIALDGSVAEGLDAIREEAVLAFHGTMSVRTRYAIELGELALLSNAWTLRAGDQEMSAITSEVARRSPHGGWLYLIDHPFAVQLPARERLNQDNTWDLPA
jgi:ketosteroid isomerase-like protein